MIRFAIFAVVALAPIARAEETHRDRFGDPLPPGAVARIGTANVHPNAQTVRFSPDGKTIITTSRTVARLWDAETGRVRRVRSGPVDHDDVPQALSADGRVAAAVFEDRLEVYDLERDRLLHRIPIPRLKEIGQAPSLDLLAIAPHGDCIFMRLNESTETLLLRDGKMEQWASPQSGYSGAHFSHDGRFVAVQSGSGEEKHLLFRASAAGSPNYSHARHCYPYALAPNGDTLLIYNPGSGYTELIDPRTLRPVAGWDFKRTTLAQSGCFSDDGRLLAIATESDVSVWDVATKQMRWKVSGTAKCLAFSPDSSRLAGVDNLLRIWDAKTGRMVGPDFGPATHCTVPTTPARQYVITIDHDAGRLQLWDWATGRIRVSVPFKGNPDTVWLSADGSQLHAYSGRLRTWEVATQKLLREVEPGPTDVEGFLVSPPQPTPDGRFLHMLFGKSERDGVRSQCTFLRWDVAGARLVERRAVKMPEFRHGKLTPDAWGLLCFGEMSAPGQIVEVRTGRPRREMAWTPPPGFQAHTPTPICPRDRLVAYSLSSSGPELYTHRTAIVERMTGRTLIEISDPVREIVYTRMTTLSYQDGPIATSPDGRWLAVARDTGLELWDLVGQRQVPFHAPYVPRDSALLGANRCDLLTFVANDRLLAQYSDMSALIWELPAAARALPDVRLSATTWAELGDADPVVARRAVWALKSDPKAGLELLRRVQRSEPISATEVAALIAELGSTRFAIREAATRRLRELGHGIEPALAALLPENAEQARRVRQLLEDLESGQPLGAVERRAVRAVHAAELLGDAGRALLESWANGADGAILTREARAALGR